MDVRPVLNAMKELISTSPSATGDGSGTTSGLSQCLQANLRSYRDLLQKSVPKCRELRSRIHHFKDAYHLTDPSMMMVDCTEDVTPQAHNTYTEFVPEGLSLLLALDEILCTLHEEDVISERSQAANQAALCSSSSASSKSKAAPRAPKSLLSVSDQKTVTGLAQFIVSLGLFPYLTPPLDALLKLRLSHAKLVEKCSSERVSSDEKTRHLYKMCCVLVQCFGNPVLGSNLLSQHISDVLVALLQICHAPPDEGSFSSKKRTDANRHGLAIELQRHCTPGDVKIKDSEGEMDTSPVDSMTASLNVCEREWCMEALQRLLSKTYQPLIVRELLAIQRISSIQDPSRGSARWLQRICGQLLSQRLLHKNGVQNVLRGVFEATVTTGTSADDSSSDWKKCQAVARIIASCPSGASTVEEYYSLISPQVLALFRLPKDDIGRQFLRVAVATVSAMMTKQRELGVAYLFQPLVQPLRQLAGEEAVVNDNLGELCEALQICIEDLHRICTVAEPSSVFLNHALPYLPVIFDLWAVTKPSNSDFRCRDVITRLLKPVPAATTINFLQFISGIKSKESRELNLKEIHFGFNISCTEGADNGSGGAYRLAIEAQSELDAVQSLDTERMERVGGCVLDLLQRDFKSSPPVLGDLFVHCLEHLASLLCKKTGYKHPKEQPAPSTNSRNSTAGRETVTSPHHPTTTECSSQSRQSPRSRSSTDSSLLLLEYGDLSFNNSSNFGSSSGGGGASRSTFTQLDLLSQHTQSYHSALVLYTAAAICEHMSSEVLLSVKIPHLLEAMSSIVGCHAHFVSPASEKVTTTNTTGVLDSQIPGKNTSGKKRAAGKGLLLVVGGGEGGGCGDLDELPGSSITLSMVLGLLSAILGGGREIERKDRPLLNSMLSPLETIASSYPDPELANLAGDLRICMATLGAVWSEEMREKADEMKSEGAFTEKVKLTAKLKGKGGSGGDRERGRKSPNSKARSLVEVCEDGGKSLKEKNSSEGGMRQAGSKTTPRKNDVSGANLTDKQGEEKGTMGGAEGESFHQALSDTRDPLVPVQGHGLISLTRLVAARDTETLSNVHQVLSIFQKHLGHPDTYIYLSAINGLVALASVAAHRDKIFATLCQEYALLSGPPVSAKNVSSRFNKETGQLKGDLMKGDSSSVKQSSKGSDKSVKSLERSSELRMKLGEALVRVARETNKLIPHYMDQVMAAVLSNARDPDPLIRASSLSNLAEVASLAKYSLVPFQNEVLSCVKHILETDKEVKVRQAALTVLKLLIKGLSQDTIQVLGDSLLEVYRLLKRVEGVERDELTRAHSQAALGELDSVMRTVLFPEPNTRPQKKITILN